MSPVLSTVPAPVPFNGSLPALIGLPIVVPFDTVDFNGPQITLPAPSTNQLVGVRYLTITHEHHPGPPDLCSNMTLPLLREEYGEDEVSYFDYLCSGIRYVQASMFYPACVYHRPNIPHTAKIWKPSLLEIITEKIYGDSGFFHNIETQVLVNASTCGRDDPYPLTLLTPPVGGQRQAYTQLAVEMLASNNQIVVTVDHSYQSGAVELDNHEILYNLVGLLIKTLEAEYDRVADLLAVARHFYNKANLFETPAGTSIMIDLNNTFVLGHGQGGMVAQMLVGSNVFSGGGSLDGLIPMPAPYTEKNVLFHNRTSSSKSASKAKQSPEPRLQPTSDHMLECLKNAVRRLRETMMGSFNAT
ncbi:unnamed protein product [Discula destructiva]